MVRPPFNNPVTTVASHLTDRYGEQTELETFVNCVRVEGPGILGGTELDRGSQRRRVGRRKRRVRLVRSETGPACHARARLNLRRLVLGYHRVIRRVKEVQTMGKTKIALRDMRNRRAHGLVVRGLKNRPSPNTLEKGWPA